jgi:cytochrome c-type biogenesis protein
MAPGIVDLLTLSLGLGLLGFVEPCSVGSSLLFVKYLEDRDRGAKVRATLVFTATRAAFIGSLGGAAAFLGSAFLDVQRGFWVLLGLLYLALGAVYLLGRQRLLMRTLGPALSRAGEAGGAGGLGVLFGLNVPACAAPLLGALLAAGIGAGTVLRGMASLALFGLALSLPLVVVVLWEPGRRALAWIGGLSRRIPRWTGVVFVGLGAWSIYFGFTVSGS